jgi:hypothetical protein
MIHILVPGRYLDWHMLACAPLQSIESINSILEVVAVQLLQDFMIQIQTNACLEPMCLT